MIDNAFRTAFNFTLAVETERYTNNPGDSGGPTKFGVTLKTLSAWRSKACSANDVRMLTVDEAMDVYYSRYWLVCGCDRMESLPKSVAVFDMAVLMGTGASVMVAQAAINHAQPLDALPVDVDGVMGPRALAALSRLEPAQFLFAYQDLLLKRVADIIREHPTDSRFRGGWESRIERLTALLDPPKATGGGVA